jgi:O-antigen ligase
MKRGTASPIAGFVTLAAIGGLALEGGGYPTRVWGLTSLGLLWVVAVGSVIGRPVHLGRLDGAMVAIVATLVAWTAASATWSVDPTQSVLESQRTLLGLAALAGLLLFVEHDSATAVLRGVTGACIVTSVAALEAWSSSGADPGVAVSLPVRYANALGLLMSMGILLMLGFLSRASPRRSRALAWFALVPMVATCYLTASLGALIALGVGLSVAVAFDPQRRRTARRTTAYLVAAALPVAAAGATISALGPGAPTAAPLRDGGASRGSVSVEPRLRFWAAGLEATARAPMIGSGAGGFERTWLQRRRVRIATRNAHNLYIETLAELGVVGLALLVAACVVPLVAAARVRHHRLVPYAAGAYAAFLAHAGVDADWEMPVLVVAAFACAGAVLVLARPTGCATPLRPHARAALASLAVGVGALTFGELIGATALDASRNAATVGAFTQASVDATVASRWLPWSGEPQRVVGDAAKAHGDLADAIKAYESAVHRDPQNWQAWQSLATVSTGVARRHAAARARRLNPLGIRCSARAECRTVARALALPRRNG